MGVKNLARTPLEAGHFPSYQDHKKEINRKNRRHNKSKSHKAKFEDDVDFEYIHVHHTSIKSERHDDKLGAVERWVESQAGRKWNDVYSEIKQKFPDTNIVNQHILQHVKWLVLNEHDRMRFSINPMERVGGRGVYIDDNGILRKFPNKRKEWSVKQASFNKNIKDLIEDIKKFLNGNVVVYEGAIPFLYTPPRYIEWHPKSAPIILGNRLFKLNRKQVKDWKGFKERLHKILKDGGNYEYNLNRYFKDIFGGKEFIRKERYYIVSSYN